MLKLESCSVGEQFPLDKADPSMFKEGWLLNEVLISVLGGGGLPPILDLAVDLLLIDPLAEPLAEVFGVRGVEAVEDELELPIWDKEQTGMQGL